MNSSVSVESKGSCEDVVDGRAIGVLNEDNNLIICSGVENTPPIDDHNILSSLNLKSSDCSTENFPKKVVDVENLIEEGIIEFDDSLSSISSVSEYAESENDENDAFDGFQVANAPQSPITSTDDEFEGFEVVDPNSTTNKQFDSQNSPIVEKHCGKNKFASILAGCVPDNTTDFTFEGFDCFNSDIENKDNKELLTNFGSTINLMKKFSSQSSMMEMQEKMFHSKYTKSVGAGTSPSKVKAGVNDDFIGHNCEVIGCTVSWLETGFARSEPATVTNGIVFELSEFAKKIAWEREYVARWITRIEGLPSESISISDEDLKKIHMVIKRRKAISVTFSGKYLLKVKLAAFDSEVFHLPSLQCQRDVGLSSTANVDMAEKLCVKFENKSVKNKKCSKNISHKSIVASRANFLACVPSKNSETCLKTNRNELKCVSSSRVNVHFGSALKQAHDLKKSGTASQLNYKSLATTNAKSTPVSNASSVSPPNSQKWSSGCDPSFNENAFPEDDSHILCRRNGKEFFLTHPSCNEHVHVPAFETSNSSMSLQSKNITCAASRGTSAYSKPPQAASSINAMAIGNTDTVGTSYSQRVCKNLPGYCAEKVCLPECPSGKVCSSSYTHAHNQSLGSFGSSLIATAVGVVHKKLDLAKISFGQHIKFASKKGKGDFAGKNVQYPIFEIRNNVIGPYCKRAELSVKMLNDPSKTILMTNGMIIELYIFFKERGATLTSLVYKIHQLTDVPLSINLIQLDMSRIQDIVNTELHKKTEYFLEKEFSFILSDAASMMHHFNKIKEPPSVLATQADLLKKINSKNYLQNETDAQRSTVKDQHQQEAANVSELSEENDSILLDLEKSRGKQGGITRGDIVSLYYSWLQHKNKDKDSVFVIDLLNDVEKLMISREIEVIRIPVGTLMSSSVKLYEEYNAYRASNPEDALAYLEDDWLEDLNYLVSSSKNVKSPVQENVSCDKCKSHVEESIALSKSSVERNASFCCCEKSGEKNSSSVNLKSIIEGSTSSTMSDCAVQEKVSTDMDSNEGTSKIESHKTFDANMPDKKRNAATNLGMFSKSSVKRSAEDEGKFNGRKSKSLKYDSKKVLNNTSEIYPPLPVISSSQFTDLTFDFRIEKVVSCRLSSKNGLSVYDYLIEWKGSSSISDTWVEEKDFPPGCTFLAKFWKDNPAKIMNVLEIKDHKKVEDSNGAENYFLVCWHKYNSLSWIMEKHMPLHASELLHKYKKSHLMKSEVPSTSSVNDSGMTKSQLTAAATAMDITEAGPDNKVTDLNDTSNEKLKTLKPGKAGVVLKDSIMTKELDEACGVGNQSVAETDGNSEQAGNDITDDSKTDAGSSMNKSLSNNQEVASIAVDANRPSQSPDEDSQRMKLRKEGSCITKTNSIEGIDPLNDASCLESSKKVNEKGSSSAISASENSAESYSSPELKCITDGIPVSGMSRVIRRPREELFSADEKAKKMKVLKTIPLGQVLNKNECLKFSDLVAQRMPANITSNSTMFYGIKQVRHLTNGKFLGMYDDWRKQKRNKNVDKSLKSFDALRNKIKTSMESYGLDYEYDDCLLGVCYSLHLTRAGLNSMADIMKFNSLPCVDTLKSFKAKHDIVWENYYKPTSKMSDSRSNEKSSKSVDKCTLSHARSNSLFYGSARKKVEQGLLTVEEQLFESDAESQAAVKEDVTELQQGLDFIEKKQHTLSSALNAYVKNVEKEKAKKTLKKFGYSGDELKDLLSLVSQNLQP